MKIIKAEGALDPASQHEMLFGVGSSLRWLSSVLDGSLSNPGFRFALRCVFFGECFLLWLPPKTCTVVWFGKWSICPLWLQRCCWLFVSLGNIAVDVRMLVKVPLDLLCWSNDELLIRYRILFVRLHEETDSMDEWGLYVLWRFQSVLTVSASLFASDRSFGCLWCCEGVFSEFMVTIVGKCYF